MDWILEKLPVLVFVVVAIAQVVRALLKQREAGAEPEGGPEESEEQQRVREIQERIRKIASQRGPRPGTSGGEDMPPVLRPEPETPVETFGELLRRGLEPVPAEKPAPVYVESRSSELERQEELAEKLRQLAEAKMLAERRAAHVAEASAEAAHSEAGLLRGERARLETELRDPESLRRAILLREILGPPLALR